MAEVPAASLSSPASSGVDRAARSGAEPSFPACPGCGKGVDPLRAGHVAISEGVFLYYCDARCKALHLRTIASHMGDDVPTLDPPGVLARAGASANVSSGLSAPARGLEAPSDPPTSHERARDEEDDFEAEEEEAEARDHEAQDEPDVAAETVPAPSAAPPRSSESAPPRRPSAHERWSREGAAPESPVPATPTSLPAPSQPEPAPRPAPSAAERARHGVSMAGVAAGLLVPLLAIADVGIALRASRARPSPPSSSLPVRLALAARDRADASPLVIAVPAVGALVAAIASYQAGGLHTAAIAVLAGLAASIGLAGL